MSQQITNFIFDVDGTILDTIDMYMPAVFEVLANHGIIIPKDEQPAKTRQWFGIPAAETLLQGGIPQDQLDAALAENLKIAYQHEDRVHMIPGVDAALDELAKRPEIKMAVATSKVRDEYRVHVAERFRFDQHMDARITATDTKRHKPFPDPILAAMKQLGAQADNTIYVGDMPNDGKAAHAAGIKFAGAMYGSVNPQAIADADFPLKTPADLLKIK
ncbi:HAD family hydrolase [Limosilactobacillus difficilis]|uniref:HAD family hydrolase n=1 Tax=Limosilactobacillus difficilis TaxID=2991838 RepID=UPI0024B89EE3|nr:HAD family hydrolase [Limosilactobacillus difficilis]